MSLKCHFLTQCFFLRQVATLRTGRGVSEGGGGVAPIEMHKRKLSMEEEKVCDEK